MLFPAMVDYRGDSVGSEVVTAACGQDAIEKATDRPPHRNSSLGVVRLLGIVATTPFRWSAPCIRTLLDYSLPGYDVSIHQYDGAARLPRSSAYCEKVVQRLVKEFGSLKLSYPGHVQGYRHLLHSASDRSVIIAMTGTASSISELLFRHRITGHRR